VGGPIGNQRLVSLDDANVVFRYTDHRDGRGKQLALSLEHFIQRIVWHVPEPGRHGVRHWGLYARGSKGVREQCRTHLVTQQPALPPTVREHREAGPRREARCAVCGRRLVFLTLWRPPPARGPPHLAQG
jgi:hypothetical protein